MTFGAGINALVFVGTNYAFSKSSRGQAEAECKQYDLAEVKFQKEKDKWNEATMKRL